MNERGNRVIPVPTMVRANSALSTNALRSAFDGLLAQPEVQPAACRGDADDEAGLSWLGPAVQPHAVCSGTRIGPYRVQDLIGRGGMGAVYRAERVDGEFRQQVALKLIRPGTDAGELALRFRREREILARLQHPNISRLLDGGVSAAGELYYAMEFIEGESIDAYCQRRCPTLRERLQLFLQICAALAYAHQNLVVHRDLKPSNLLVTGDGTVKLLDFGIAKLLDGDGVDGGSDLTRAEDRLLTPSYAAPEQVLGQAITTATDVYALGLVLSEMLTGARAQPVAGRSMLDAERSVVQTEARAPSAVMIDLVEQPSDRNEIHFGITPDRSRARLLLGDLDAIVLKALRKEPAQRYASVPLLAEDVQRHLDGRVVSAVSGAFAYRAGKLLRRHRVAVGAVAAVLLALLVGMATALWQAQRASQQAARAEQVKDFVLGLFRGVDPQLAQGREITARELLDRGILNLHRDLAAQPDIHAQMLESLGAIYAQLNHREEAAKLFEESLALRRGNLPAADAGLLPSLLGLAEVWVSQSHYEDARRLLVEADSILAASGVQAQAQRAQALNLWISVRVRTGQVVQAQATAREMEALQLQRWGASHPEFASALVRHAWVDVWIGRYAEADKLLHEALAIDLRTLGELNAQTRLVYGQLGNLAYYRGSYRQSRDDFARALAIDEQIYGKGYVSTLGERGFLWRAEGELGHVDAAERGLREVVEEFAQPLNREHAERPFHTWSLARLLAARGKLSEAAQWQQQVVTQIRAASGEQAKISLYAGRDLGAIWAAAGRTDAALGLLQPARNGLSAVEGEHGMQVARADIWIAECQRQQRRLPDALRRIEHAQAVLSESLGTQHDETAMAQLVRGRILFDSGQPQLAAAPLRRAVEVNEALFGPADLRVANPRFLLGLALQTAHDPTGQPMAELAAQAIVDAPGNQSLLHDEAQSWQRSEIRANRGRGAGNRSGGIP